MKLCLELSLYTPALLVLHGVMASDDQEVEAWYLEGWCFFLMSEQAQEHGGRLDELTWQELAKDARECLETCQVVRIAVFLCYFRYSSPALAQLHTREEHPDIPLLEHVKELIAKLDALGIAPSPSESGGSDCDDEGWEDVDSSEDGDGDVKMD